MTRRAVVVLAMLVGLGSLHDTAERGAAGEPAARPYHAARPGSLAAAKRRLAAGDATVRAAVDSLVAAADDLLTVQPPAVTDKQKPAASGDLHDYASLAPYYWPDPAAPDGLPYVRRDGRRNPEADDARFTDRDRANLLGGAIETLGLAWQFTGRERYATQAAAFARAWFVSEATRMNPHLRHAQAVRGANDGRGAGILEGRDIVTALDAVALIDDSGAVSAADRAAVDAWAAAYLDWLLESDHGRHERAAVNNHGSFFDGQVAQLALMTGRRDLAVSVLEEVGQQRIAVQIEPDGSQPYELVRTKSLGYSRFNLEALCRLATLAEHAGIDLWHFQTRDGRSIRRAIDFLMPYVTAPHRWPHEQISRLDQADFATILWQAGIVYRDPRYAALVAGFASDQDGWIRLTFVDD